MSAPEAKASPEPDDDMHDPNDRDDEFPLGEFLQACDPHAPRRLCEPCLRSDYERADDLATRGRRKHLWFVGLSVASGFIALFWGLLQQLFGEKYPDFLKAPGPGWKMEFLFTILALVLVLVTLFFETHQTWLIERYKAEALRLVKFRLLIRPNLWNGSTGNLLPLKNDLDARRAMIAETPSRLLEALAHSDALPDLPPTNDSLGVEPHALARLLDYYRRKRLDFQLHYFERKMRERMGILESSLLQPVFFFFGLALSLANLLLESPWVDSHNDWLIRTFVFGSLALPFGWGAIRTLRGANERLRNQARSHARYDSLAEIRKSLDNATAGDPERWDRPMIFGYLYICESILASDQHEWLRLMKEAEAYG